MCDFRDARQYKAALKKENDEQALANKFGIRSQVTQTTLKESGYSCSSYRALDACGVGRAGISVSMRCRSSPRRRGGDGMGSRGGNVCSWHDLPNLSIIALHIP
jgi:hypothetical protein